MKMTTQSFKEAIKLTSELEDNPTEDLLIGTIKSLEKHIWMLNAFLG